MQRHRRAVRPVSESEIMKAHHVSILIGVSLLVCASMTKDREFAGWWSVGGLMFIALGFVLLITRR